MRKLFFSLSLTLMSAWGQETAAPTPDQPGNSNGDTVNKYNIVQSFELGYRWRTSGGDEDMYRSTVNFRDGVRLLSGSLFVKSMEGHGHWFDEITLTTQGLGNDPYQSAMLRVEKNGMYRYDMLWRSTDYFNPSFDISGGEHFMDTTRAMQDHDLTLFPQSRVKFFLGYSRNVEDGPALTTIQLFNPAGNEFPVFQDILQRENEYRLGAEARLLEAMLSAIGTARNNSYYAYFSPWRPPGGQAFAPHVASALAPFARRHIELARPKAVLLLGDAARHVLGSSETPTRLYAKPFELRLGEQTIFAVPAPGLSAMLRTSALKPRAWSALRIIGALLAKS